MVFPCGSAGKESACNVGDLGSIPGLGRSPGEGNSCPLQYSGLENSMDCIIHGVTKSWTQLHDFHFHIFPAGESVDQHNNHTIVITITIIISVEKTSGYFEILHYLKKKLPLCLLSRPHIIKLQYCQEWMNLQLTLKQDGMRPDLRLEQETPVQVFLRDQRIKDLDKFESRN